MKRHIWVLGLALTGFGLTAYAAPPGSSETETIDLDELQIYNPFGISHSFIRETVQIHEASISLAAAGDERCIAWLVSRRYSGGAVVQSRLLLSLVGRQGSNSTRVTFNQPVVVRVDDSAGEYVELEVMTIPQGDPCYATGNVFATAFAE